MFTKNIKLIGIVALIVVIVMVLSAVIAINNDKKVSAEIDSAVEDIESSYEKKIAELYGIGVQVANADDTKLADNDITLVAAGK